MSDSAPGDAPDGDGELVQFVGGPWDGEARRSCRLVDLSDMAAPGGGSYLFGGLDDDGEVVYVYECDEATRRWPDEV
jgi:hypothetical protein